MEQKSCPYGKCVLTEIIDGRGVRYIEQKHYYRCVIAKMIKEGKTMKQAIVGKDKKDVETIEARLECPDHDCKYFSGEEIFDRIGEQ